MAINVSKRYNILQFEDSIIIDFESKLSVDIDVLDVYMFFRCYRCFYFFSKCGQFVFVQFVCTNFYNKY